MDSSRWHHRDRRLSAWRRLRRVARRFARGVSAKPAAKPPWGEADGTALGKARGILGERKISGRASLL
eukprot:2595851-Alexandrium_andersonii.AAC.1